MIDISKFDKIYEELKNVTPDDFIQIIINSKTKEEKDFFIMLGNAMLQKEQMQAVEKGLF